MNDVSPALMLGYHRMMQVKLVPLDTHYSDGVRGSLFGCAVGDALGYPIEFSNIDPREPIVKDLLPGPKGISLFSDDTQMTIAAAEGLLESRDRLTIMGSAPNVAERFIAWSKSPENNRAPGNACMFGCAQLAQGTTWFKAGKQNGGGCGAAMRSAPYGWLFHDDWYRAATWAGEHALMTHRSSMAQASAAAVAAGVSAALMGMSVMRIASMMHIAADMYDAETGEMLEHAIHDAKKGVAPNEVLGRWRGWAGHEAVAASLYCFLRHPADLEKAVLEAVNSPGDSDSLGAITGALSGAFNGINAVPQRWIDVIEKRDELAVIATRFIETFERK